MNRHCRIKGTKQQKNYMEENKMKTGTGTGTGTGAVTETEKVRLNCEVEVAKQAVKEAKEAVLVAIRASQEPYDKVWLNLEEEKLDYTAFCGL
jgi:DNA-binding FadR family transcriptional regulator